MTRPATFAPSAAAVTYETVQDEAYTFYEAQGDKSGGTCSRLAAQAAKRWMREQLTTHAAEIRAAAAGQSFDETIVRNLIGDRAAYTNLCLGEMAEIVLREMTSEGR